MKKRMFSLAMALVMVISLLPAALAAEETPILISAPADSPVLLVELNTQRVGGGGMGTAVGIYDYPQYFDDHGVNGVVAAGGFYINGFQVPANAEELAALGEGGFVVNEGTMSLTAKDGKFKVGKNETDDYMAAIKALISDELPGGLHMYLYDTDGDQKAEQVKLLYTEGVIVNRISRMMDGCYALSRGDLERVPSHAGRLYDKENFSANSTKEIIKAENFDTEIKEGDGAIFYLTPDGWIVKRAKEANGIFMDGVDHDFYQIDDVKYTDTMKYSRDNLIVAQRNGEFANAQTYFGFKANTDGLKVSMWMDTYSDSPIGITANENAKVFLAKAIEQAKAKFAAVTLAADATGEQKFAYAALEEAIKLAEETLADADSYNSEYDFYTYYLYLALAGTGKDIGAAFSGFFSNKEFGWERMNAFPGFEALFAAKEPEPAPAGETYTVVAGDCLWAIAAKHLGSGALYTKIAEANGIKDANLIYVGQELTIPAK